MVVAPLQKLGEKRSLAWVLPKQALYLLRRGRKEEAAALVEPAVKYWFGARSPKQFVETASLLSLALDADLNRQIHLQHAIVGALLSLDNRELLVRARARLGELYGKRAQ
jgi:hypothetical protein